MKKTILIFSILIIAATHVQAQSYEQTVAFLKEHMTNSSCFFSDRKVVVDNTYITIMETKGNSITIYQIPLNKIISVDDGDRDDYGSRYPRIVTHGNDIGVGDADGKHYDSHCDFGVASGCITDGEWSKMLRALRHLAELNRATFNDPF